MNSDRQPQRAMYRTLFDGCDRFCRLPVVPNDQSNNDGLSRLLVCVLAATKQHWCPAITSKCA